MALSGNGSGLTSFLVTGFSSNDKCVSLAKFRNGSKSASSAKLLDVRTRVVRLGMLAARFDWMLLTRLRARRMVWSLGERGKFERVVMSLSVKSIASWSCLSISAGFEGWERGLFRGTYSSDGQIFNGGDFVTCVPRI